MTEPTAAQMRCGHAMYGPPAICTCGTCPPPPTGGKRPTDSCHFYGGKPCGPEEACECEIWNE